MLCFMRVMVFGVHDLLHATTKVVKIRQKCKKIRQNRISMPCFF